MLIETTIQEKKTVEIQLPIFYKDPQSHGNEMIAVLGEKHFINLYRTETYLSIRVTDANLNSAYISKAINEWEQITEEEFMKAYNDTLLSLSLEPKEVSKDDVKDIPFR